MAFSAVMSVGEPNTGKLKVSQLDEKSSLGFLDPTPLILNPKP